MLQVNKQDNPRPKCYFSSSTLPKHISHEQPPAKKKPFSTIASQTYYHSVDVVLPEASAGNLQSSISSSNEKAPMRYARVCMKLSEIITGDFFNQYIKTGNILMLSEGRPGIDRLFSLCEGILRLELDRPTYERLGLQGTPIPSSGRKHVKARYAIELNLRLPSMLSGKKGFERMKHAFQNALDEPVVWLFYNCADPNDGSGPVTAKVLALKTIEAELRSIGNATLPVFLDSPEVEDEDNAAEQLEWLSLAFQSSPRITSHDSIDPHLSRYQIPAGRNAASAETKRSAQHLVSLRWRGFMPASVVHTIFLNTVKTSDHGWFALTASGFDGTTCTILQNGQRTLTWEYAD